MDAKSVAQKKSDHKEVAAAGRRGMVLPHALWICIGYILYVVFHRTRKMGSRFVSRCLGDGAHAWCYVRKLGNYPNYSFNI